MLVDPCTYIWMSIRNYRYGHSINVIMCGIDSAAAATFGSNSIFISPLFLHLHLHQPPPSLRYVLDVCKSSAYAMYNQVKRRVMHSSDMTRRKKWKGGRKLLLLWISKAAVVASAAATDFECISLSQTQKKEMDATSMRACA